LPQPSHSTPGNG